MATIALRLVSFSSPLVCALIDEWNDELGFIPKGGSTVEVTDFEPPGGAFLLAMSEDQAVACGGLRSLTPTSGEIKRLFVSSAARRRGVARILLSELERRAAGLGLVKVRLDTDAGATAALALFHSLGYRPIKDYNGNPYASHWFEKQIRAGGG